MEEWAKFVIQLGALGGMTWVLYHVFTSLLPKMMDSFDANLAKQTEKFSIALAEQREDFARINDQNRIIHIDALKGMAESLRISQDKLTSAIAESNVEARTERDFRRKK